MRPAPNRKFDCKKLQTDSTVLQAWCHVMERESFENEETATIMNENFVSIAQMSKQPDKQAKKGFGLK